MTSTAARGLMLRRRACCANPASLIGHCAPGSAPVAERHFPIVRSTRRVRGRTLPRATSETLSEKTFDHLADETLSSLDETLSSLVDRLGDLDAVDTDASRKAS